MVNDPTIDTTSPTGKLVTGILALIAEFENDIRRERQMDGIAKARDRGVKFGRKPILVPKTIKQVRKLRKFGKTVPKIMRQTPLSKASDSTLGLCQRATCYHPPGFRSERRENVPCVNSPLCPGAV